MKMTNCGYIYNTDKATRSWEERTEFDGMNDISLATGSQWNHEKLHVTGNERFFVHWWSQWQGSRERLFPRPSGWFGISTNSPQALWES